MTHSGLTDKSDNSEASRLVAAEAVASSVLADALFNVSDRENISNNSRSSSSSSPFSRSVQSLSRDNENEVLPPLLEVVDNVVQEEEEEEEEDIGEEFARNNENEVLPPLLEVVDNVVQEEEEEEEEELGEEFARNNENEVLPPLLEVVDNIVHEEEEEELEEDAVMRSLDKQTSSVLTLPPPPPPLRDENDTSIASIEERLDQALSEVSHLHFDNLTSTLTQSLASGAESSLRRQPQSDRENTKSESKFSSN